MALKFAYRTIRNLVLRDHPYFAHLALTHRCNLRCRFCRVQEERFEELDTEGMKRVIDVLEGMGVAVLSISGGGEPLLRGDFAEILDYAAGKGLYTKITSNGTMPLAKYRELLGSKVKEIGISVDGVEGNDLPFSHVGPRILDTIRYLNDHLPPGKKLTLNVTVSAANYDKVDGIVAYLTREFPRARIWLNPVVTGSGMLRNGEPFKIEPTYLERLKSPTLLKARFYKEGVYEQYRKDTYDWGCKAGRMFFDVKPNGDFWLCQDKAANARLNVLDPDFKKEFVKADVRSRRRCSGCTYSCYFLTQKGFEPANWRDMAVLWWTAATSPGEPCREAAEKYGWVAGLLSYLGSRMRPAAATAALVLALALTVGMGVARGQSLAPEEVITLMEQNNEARQKALAAYESTRRYAAGNQRLRRHAEVVAELRFTAPGEKDFSIVSREGSGLIQRKVIEPAMEAERMNAAEPARRQVDISRRNYDFKYTGLDEERHAYVFEAAPKTANKYLFRGKVWVDATSYAVRRTEGEPAVRPSFWVLRTHFVHEYGEIGGFWLPLRHRSVAELRLFGQSTLVIDYYDYRWVVRTAGHEDSFRE